MAVKGLRTVNNLVTAVPAVMRYTLISRQDLIDSLLADSTVPRNSGNRCIFNIER